MIVGGFWKSIIIKRDVGDVEEGVLRNVEDGEGEGCWNLYTRQRI